MNSISEEIDEEIGCPWTVADHQAAHTISALCRVLDRRLAALEKASAEKEKPKGGDVPELRPGDVVRVSFASCAYMLSEKHFGLAMWRAIRLGQLDSTMPAFETGEIHPREVTAVYRDGKLLWSEEAAHGR